jgi:hypothetical protein
MCCAVVHELGRQRLTRQFVQAEQVLEELVVFVWSIDIYQTGQCLHLTRQSQFEPIGNLPMVAAKQGVIYALVLVGCSESQLVHLKILVETL